MSVLQELIQETSGYLQLRTQVVARQGSQINVGEKFRVQFMLTNIAPPPTAFGQPRIRFTMLI